ncbi:MAG: septum formation initiator family protein [Ignavibacteriae bacterium]|nr:septum formation initiator family protein [Ignavibacteriota bacterium]
MDGIFYRKEKESLGLKAKALRLLKSKRFMVRFVPAVFVCGYILFGSHGLVQRLRLQNEKAELEAKIQNAEAESKRLQAELKALDGDPKAIEKVAREKYKMTREGETVYKVARK